MREISPAQNLSAEEYLAHLPPPFRDANLSMLWAAGDEGQLLQQLCGAET